MSNTLWHPFFPLLITTRYPSSSPCSFATRRATMSRWPNKASSSSSARLNCVIGFFGMTRKCTGACGDKSLNAQQRSSSKLDDEDDDGKQQHNRVARREVRTTCETHQHRFTHLATIVGDTRGWISSKYVNRFVWCMPHVCARMLCVLLLLF